MYIWIHKYKYRNRSYTHRPIATIHATRPIDPGHHPCHQPRPAQPPAQPASPDHQASQPSPELERFTSVTE